MSSFSSVVQTDVRKVNRAITEGVQPKYLFCFSNIVFIFLGFSALDITWMKWNAIT
jgi:hypothetical protein